MTHQPGTRPSRFIERQSRRRGAMLVLILLLLPIFLFLVAISVDIGYMQLVRTELHAATDSSVRAAGATFSRSQNQADARQAAKDLAAANQVAGKPLLLADSDIVFGRSALEPNGAWTFTADATPINAVRVHARRTADSPSGSVPLFFGRFLGVNAIEPTRSASVVQLDRDICFVLDRSSSMKLSLSCPDEFMSSSDPRYSEPPIMNDSRWGALSVAVQGFLDAIASTPYEEHAALVSYASNGTWCGFTNYTSDRNQALTADYSQVTAAMQAISNTVFNGNTNISAGIDTGVVALTDSATARPYAAKTIVLLTDGHYNQGRPPDLAAADAASQNIIIHTITFGEETDEVLMSQVSSVTGGNHYHAPDAAALQQIFRQIALSQPVVLTD